MLVPGGKARQTIFFQYRHGLSDCGGTKEGAIGDASFIIALFSARQTRLAVVNVISVQMIH